MKEELRRLVANTPSPASAVGPVREYLQSRILGLMQDAGAMITLAICGGTALRFLFGMPRYSEDLDFSLEREAPHFSLQPMVEKITGVLAREGYAVDAARSGETGAVHSVMLRFPGLPHELGLSLRKEQNLSIRIEVDTRPPGGAVLAVSTVRVFQLLRLQHHDRSSLLAGKIHAVLTREYTKGRDIYDLLWYLSGRGWPAPNMVLLGNALAQSGWPGERVAGIDLREELEERFRSLDWAAVRRDVLPFLEKPGEADLLNENDMRALLRGLDW